MPSIEARGSRQRQGKPTPALAALIDRNDAALPADIDGRGNFALLPPALWGRLFPASSSSTSQEQQRQFVAVTFPAQQSPDAAGKPVNVTYAATCLQQDVEGQDPTSATQQPIFLSFLPYGYSRQQPTLVTASPLRPLPISSIILSTSSRSIVREASSSTFRDGLAGTLVRQGHLVRLPQGRLRAVQCEPVMQGVVDASTQVLVVHDAGFDDQEDDEASYAEGSAGPVGAEGDNDIERNLAGLSIDERFLANSVLEDFDEEADEVDELQHDLAPGLPNGHPPEAARAARSHAHDAGIEAWPIANRKALMQAIESWQSRQEGRSEVDEESAMLLQEEKLAAIGGFDGDWAVIEIAGQSRPRLVRIFSCSSSTPLRAYLPPTLLQNLHDPASFAPNPPSPPRLLITPVRHTPSSSDVSSTPLACPLPIPFADSLTIARVPSALSVNRAYQPLFLDALRRYFEGHKRIVKEGDVIAVGVDKGKVRWVAPAKNSEDGGKEGQEGMQQEEEEPVDFDLSPSSSSRHPIHTGIVHFHVSSLTSELGPPSTDTSSHHDHANFELRESARLGALGSVVDPTLTKMVQTGITGRRVADCDGWLGIASSTPPLPTGSTPLSSPTSPFSRLTQLVHATLLPSATSYGLHLSVLLLGARGSGKKTVAGWVAKQTGVHLVDVNCFDVLGDSDTQTEGVLRARFEAAAGCGPAILLLRNIDALARKSQALETGQEPAMSHVLRDCMRSLRRGGEAGQGKGGSVSVFATTSDADKVPNGILAAFKHEVKIEAPNEAERYEILETALQGERLSPDASVKEMATQTAALVAADLVDLVARARLAASERVRKALAQHHHQFPGSGSLPRTLHLSGTHLTGSDLSHALSAARTAYSTSIGAPKIPSVTWDDVGGLASVKSDILDTIQLPLEHPELFSSGLKKRSGILLYGPPGTGKTLLAKAVATSCSLNFFSVKGPELLNMYIGESEANVRRVFQRARDAKPCVIFFDELDSVAPKRGNQGDSGGVMDRIVSQLLAELDGMSSGSSGGGGDVFVIGATNRPDLLDPALLRPGRFDKMLYLSVSETHDAQRNVLEALTRKFRLEDDCKDLSVIASQCPFNLTGADFYALASDAMLKAMTRAASAVDERIKAINEGLIPIDDRHPKPMTAPYYLSELASKEEIEVRVGRGDFEGALRELVPSVSEAEMGHYRRVQAQFSGPVGEGKKEEEEEEGRRGGSGRSREEEERDGVLAGLLERARSQAAGQGGGGSAGAGGSGSGGAATAGSGSGGGGGASSAAPYAVPQPQDDNLVAPTPVQPQPQPANGQADEPVANGSGSSSTGKGKGKGKGKAKAED